jgi:hypothetical protein
MRKNMIVAALTISLAGCESTVSTLFQPMEPTRESVAATRRALTPAEKEQVSDAVSLRLKASVPREFKWAPLVLESHDHVTDYCGLVSGNDIDDKFTGYSKFLAQLTFANDGKISKVDVRSIAKSRAAYPTELDSLCIQEGYGGLPVMPEYLK